MIKRRFAISLTVLLTLISVVYASHSIITAYVPTLVEMETLPIILLDAGHGGIDGGAEGVDGVIEKDINLSIALMLRDQFVVNGFDVVMTRDTDISIHDEGVEGVRNQKTSDLKNRLAIAESYSNVIFISIHQNKFGEASSWGTQVFYGPVHPQSQKLAEITQATIVEMLQPDNSREIKEAGKNLYLMYNATCPTILVECGFLSNAADAANLTDPEYQSKLSFAILSSVLDYLDMDKMDGATMQSAQEA